MNTEDIQRELYNHHLHCSRYEVNFILSHTNTIACFMPLKEAYHGLFAIVDSNYMPLYQLETNAYIHACGISDDGEYAVFQTAYSPYDDSAKLFLIDIANRRICWKKELSPNWKTITSYYLDPQNDEIFEHHDRDDSFCKYNFDGVILQRGTTMHNPDKTSQMISDTVESYTRTQKYHSESADALNALRQKAMDELHRKAEEEDNIYDPEFEKEIEERLAKLDEESRSEFYRIRTHRKNDGILSAREIDLLTLEAMERSYYHYMGIEYEKPKYKKEFHFGG